MLAGVSRCYGEKVALAPLTLCMEAGTLCAVQGPNGSGKTTLLRMAAGVLAPSTGRRHARGRALYMRAGDGVRAAQTPRQALRFAAAVSGSMCSVAAVLADTGLADVADITAARLSAGQRARVALAMVLACRPAIACLDEPTAHLDTAGRAMVTRVVRELRETETVVLIATHDDDLVSDIADGRLRLREGTVGTEPW